MRSPLIMLIAGEPSGDQLASELVTALRTHPGLRALPFPPRFFGAGGSRLAAADVEICLDLTKHAAIGLFEVLRKLPVFRRCLRQLVDLACQRQPDLVVCVDFSGFNRRWAHALRLYLRHQNRVFNNWRPRLVQYVSPQVWASRPGRAVTLEQDFDLVLCLFPFERDWYARHAPRLPVAFVGHPLLDRHRTALLAAASNPPEAADRPPRVLLLPGSRTGEIERHLPVMLAAAERIRKVVPVDLVLVSADASSEAQARRWGADRFEGLRLQVGGLAEALQQASLAIASTGTVTLECALFAMPAVTLYRTSWATYQVARHVATVSHLSMPNLLAGREVYPEFVQHRATAANLATAALALLRDPERRQGVKRDLGRIVQSLGGPGACDRAATAIAGLLSGDAG